MRTAAIMTTGAFLLTLACLAALAVNQHWSCAVMNIVSPMEPVATRAALEPVWLDPAAGAVSRA